ncbi:cytochrome-c peroxidase, partial [Weeksellaceae bacterium TAE3-ERU29]|nr:cytochrome-c peroxidase [Weeksellaceae bacterium TAE3-ERU29]
MKKFFILSFFTLLFFSCKNNNSKEKNEEYSIVDLYKKPVSEWPKPTIDKGVEWEELSPITTDTAYYSTMENPEVVLGLKLFFDPKLSSSNQISCSTCHNPEMGWTTHTEKAIGHDHLEGSRNTPSIFNVASKNIFFWDGRASSLEEQAIGPIGAHNEMNMELKKLPEKLSKIKAYPDLFLKAYGQKEITEDKILKALAAFQKTIKSQPSRVDDFMLGDYKALNDSEIRGLHVFRTKGRCMNCHNGKYLTDQKFHNIGLTYYGREYEDLGRYNITKNPDDVGKFLTPSLRDLLNTRPWMHNGLFDDLIGVISMYQSGMQMMNPTKEEKEADPLYPVIDSLMKPLDLTVQESEDLEAFL